MKKKVLVGMSGGVDSSVAALLLKQAGFQVTGVFMKLWDEKNTIKTFECKSACYGPEKNDIEDAQKVADMLGIKLAIVDVRHEYEKAVLDYFRAESEKGRTPNPCVVCNRTVKFGVLLDKSAAAGMDFDVFATGHYAGIFHNHKRNLHLLRKGKDGNKDQSYFLCMLSGKQLSNLVFPLSDYTKKEVRNIARLNKLPVSEKSESQDFIAGKKEDIFGGKIREGDIVSTDGTFLGKHKGINYYTLGQRKGLGISGGEPLYVVRINPEQNSVILGKKSDLQKKSLSAERISLNCKILYEKPFECNVKIRYRHPESPATVYPEKERRAKIVFKYPQNAITPGQVAAFYRGNTVLGGGFIEESL